MSALDHVGISVTDSERSKAFYVRALEPLGIKLLMEFGTHCGFGTAKPDFWFGSDTMAFQTDAQRKVITPVHVCFAAPNRRAVDAFYAAAIAAGGRDNGKPGIREVYHPNYYGAFVLDPDGHNVEACVHR